MNGLINGTFHVNRLRVGNEANGDIFSVDEFGRIQFTGSARVVGQVGKSYYLDPANGDDTNDGLSPDKAVKTLPVAYGLLTENQNDILFYIAGTGSISLSSSFTWAKSYTHFIGICAPVSAGKRARIFQTRLPLLLQPVVESLLRNKEF